MISLEGQFVCQKCGYNMIGYYPQFCPFCGASNENFITAKKCSKRYKIISSKVNDNISRLYSYPSLGLEHSAYCIKVNNSNIWIDCPASFDEDLDPMDKILFTHHHFLGACNLYRGYYTAFVWIHKNDSKHSLAKNYHFDRKFSQNFKLSGIEAFHINGHTSGFTFYIFEDTMFICDYLIKSGERFILNPYSQLHTTKEGAMKLKEIIQNREIEIVCGVNYVIKYQIWKKEFINLLDYY